MADPPPGHRALREGAAFLPLAGRAAIEVRGGDRAVFLHGQTSQDVKGLAAGRLAYAAILTNRGRIEADLWIWNPGDRLLLEAEGPLRESVLARLRKFVISEDVSIEDASGSISAIRLAGPRAPAVLEATHGAGSLDPGAFAEPACFPGPIRAGRLPETAGGGFTLLVPPGESDALVAALAAAGAEPAPSEAWETLRIERGIPRLGADFGEESFPAECGLDETAVSFSKGCYVGQETVARMHTYGGPRRRLVGLALGGATAPAPGARIWLAGAEIGAVTSACLSPALGRPVALGYVKTEHAAPGTRVEVDSSAGRGTAEVRARPIA